MTETDNDIASLQNRTSLTGLLIGAAVLITLIFLVSFVFNRSSNRPIKPIISTGTPGALLTNYAPESVSFFDLETDPTQYLNQRIRVTGRFTHIEQPLCQPYSGPRIKWGIIDDTLQMNALGYESVVKSLPNNIEMTLEGIWKFYPGAVGCGKESQANNGLWYIHVEHILQPNPLPIAGINGLAQVGITDSEPLQPPNPVGEQPPGTSEAVATEIGTPEFTATNTATPSSTPTQIGTIGPTTTPDGSATATFTPSATSTQAATTTTITNTPAASTPPSGTVTPTLIPTNTAVPTSGPPVGSTSTPNPGGYPAPTPGPYP